MCKHSLCKYLSELNAFLVKAVHIPEEALEHHLILKMSKESSDRFRCELISDYDA